MFGYTNVPPEYQIYVDQARKARSEFWKSAFASVARGIRAIGRRIRSEAAFVVRAPLRARTR